MGIVAHGQPTGGAAEVILGGALWAAALWAGPLVITAVSVLAAAISLGFAARLRAQLSGKPPELCGCGGVDAPTHPVLVLRAVLMAALAASLTISAGGADAGLDAPVAVQAALAGAALGLIGLAAPAAVALARVTADELWAEEPVRAR